MKLFTYEISANSHVLVLFKHAINHETRLLDMFAHNKDHCKHIESHIREYKKIQKTFRLVRIENGLFIHELSILNLEHTAETVKQALGTDYYNPDFGIDIHARMFLNDLFQAAETDCLMRNMDSISKGSAKDEALNAIADMYAAMHRSMKLIKTEDA